MENEKAKLKEAFESATSCEESFDAVTEMTKSGLFDQTDLDSAYFKVSLKFMEQPQDFILRMEKKGNMSENEANLKIGFYNAESAAEMLTRFRKMEEAQVSLGMEFFSLTQKVLEEEKLDDPEKMLLFGQKALKFFTMRMDILGNHGLAWMIVSPWLVLGSAFCKLRKVEDSSRCLSQCEKYFNQFLMNRDFPLVGVLVNKLCDVHMKIGQVKASAGAEYEDHLEKSLEIIKKWQPKDSIDIGSAYNRAADVLLSTGNFKQAIPRALKALEIYSAKWPEIASEILLTLGQSLTRTLCVMIRYEKALLKQKSPKSRLALINELEKATMPLLFNFKEGVGVMETVIKNAEVQGADLIRASGCVALAHAFLHQDYLDDANKYLKLAQEIVEKKEIGPQALGIALREMDQQKSFDPALLDDATLLGALIGMWANADGVMGPVEEVNERASGGEEKSKPGV